jgi:hypothetical protein
LQSVQSAWEVRVLPRRTTAGTNLYLDDDRQWVIDAATTVPGVLDA